LITLFLLCIIELENTILCKLIKGVELTMKKVKKYTIIILILIFILLTPLKLFTVKVTYSNDPSTTIALTSKPIFSNFMKVTLDENLSQSQFFEKNNFYKTYTDENHWEHWYNSSVIVWWLLITSFCFIIIRHYLGHKKRA